MSRSGLVALLVWANVLGVQSQTAVPVPSISSQAKDLTLAQGGKPLPNLVADADQDDEPVDILDEVTVTASLGRKVKARETTSSIYVVNTQEIERKGSRQVGDALRGVPGVVSNMWGAGEDVHSTYFIRGLPTTSTGLLIDGRSVNNLNQEHVDLAELPVYDIERIEVLKGGASSVLYGSTAVGGAINIIPRTTPKKFEVDSNVTFGSYGFSQYSARIGGPLSDNFRYALFATTFNSNNNYAYQVNRDDRTLFGVNYPAQTLTGIRPGGEVSSSTFGVNFDWDIDQRTTLKSTTYLRRGIRGVNLFSLVDPRTAIQTSGNSGCIQDPFCTATELGLNDETRPQIRIDYFGTAFTLDRKLGEGDDSNLKIRLGYDTGFTTETDVNSDFIRELDKTTQITVLNARIQHDWQVTPGINLTYGFDFIRESGRSFTLDLLTPGATQNIAFTAQVNRPSLFGVGTFKLTDNITATLGFRGTFANSYSFNSTTYFVGQSSLNYAGSFDPSVGIVWSITPQFALRSSFARVYKTPNFNDLFANGEIQGNPGLVPESGSTFDVGFDWQAAPNLTVRGAYFVNDIQNLLAYNRINPLQDGSIAPQDQGLIDQGYALGDLVRVNFPQTKFTGFELSFDWRFAPGWTFFGTETYTDARITQGFKPELDQNQYPLVPYHSGQLGFTFASPGDWRFALFSNFQGLRPSDPYHLGPSVGFTPNGDLATFPTGNLIPNIGYLAPGSLLPGYLTLDLTFHIPLSPNVALNGFLNNLTNLAYERNYGNGAPPANFTLGVETHF